MLLKFLEEFKKLHVSLKTIVLAIIVLLPFWYIDLYIFKKGFVSKDYFQPIPIIITFCFCTTWFAFNFISAFLFSIYISKSSISDGFSFEILISIFFSLIHLIIPSYIAYKLKIDFENLIDFLFGWTLIRIISWVFLLYKQTSKKKLL